MNRYPGRLQGMTLIEMMLVMIGIALLLVMLLNYSTKKAFDNRIERTTEQMQSILVAAQNYYVKVGTWPTSVATLQTAGYLPANVQSSFGGNQFDVVSSAGGQLFYVSTLISGPSSAASIARNIAGRLPLSYLSTMPASPGIVPPNTSCAAAAPACRVVAAVNVPAQALNEARRITYTGLVHHGGCIPVVPCSVSGSVLTPQIMVAPVSVSGINKETEPSSVYPISSFTAFATGGPGAGVNPPECPGAWARIPCNPSAGSTVTDYWRVCLRVITPVGNVATTNTGSWGRLVTLLGITRCTNTNGTEPSGSTFSVYSR